MPLPRPQSEDIFLQLELALFAVAEFGRAGVRAGLEPYLRQRGARRRAGLVGAAGSWTIARAASLVPGL